MVAIHAPCLLPASFGRCLTRPNVLKQASFVRLQEANTAPEKSSDTFSRLLGILTLNNNSIAVTLNRMHNLNQRTPHSDDLFTIYLSARAHPSLSASGESSVFAPLLPRQSLSSCLPDVRDLISLSVRKMQCRNPWTPT
jgi:hypothetical protein